MRVFIENRLRYLRMLSEALGYRQAAWHLLRRRLAPTPGGGLVYKPIGAAFPLQVRPGTSDWEVLLHIFGAREYGCLDDVPNVDVVIDCGANVGYASAYFLTRHPHSRVIAIEPDPDNFAALVENLRPYGDRAEAIHAAVWSRDTSLVLANENYRDDGAWARQVRDAGPGEVGDVAALGIASAIALGGKAQVSILKMDIEGAEAVVFGADCAGWLPQVQAIAIELHDDSSFGKASDLFFRAIAGEGFRVARHGELTVCRRDGSQLGAGVKLAPQS